MKTPNASAYSSPAVDVICFAIHLDYLTFVKMTLRRLIASWSNIFFLYLIEDQLDMKFKNTVSAVSNIAGKGHRRMIQGFSMSRLTFKYRLYPNRQQREKLQATLDVCRELYNAGLQERRDAWSSHRKGIGYLAQANQLRDIKTVREDLAAVHSQVLQDVLRRLDKTFQSFFLRVKRGQKAGFPRFRSNNRYHSFTYPQTGLQLNGRLSLSKIGDIKIKLHRPVKGEIKTLTIKRENGFWYACFSCVVEPEPLPTNDKAVGIDVGLNSFAVLSDGTEIENPRLLKKQQKRLGRAQRRVARRKKFSQRWKEAVRIVAKIHRKVFNQRNDFQHKLSREIVNNYGLIAVEDLNVKSISRGMLEIAVHDA